MIERKNGFEGVGDGSAVTTALADPNAFDAVSTGTGASIVGNGVGAHGTRSARFATGATSTTAYLQWAVSGESELYFRFNLYLEALPPTNHRLVQFGNASGSCCDLELRTDGIRFRNQNSGANAFFALPALDTWMRIEGRIVFHATEGVAQIRIYDERNSVIADESFDSSADGQFRGDPTYARFGIVGNTANQTGLLLDDVALSSEDWLGPVEPPNLAPTVTTAQPFHATQVGRPVLLETESSDPEDDTLTRSWEVIENEYVPYPPGLIDSTSGQTTGTTVPIALPEREPGDYVTLILSSNQTPSYTFAAGVETSTLLASAGSRLQAFRIVPSEGATSITATAQNAIHTWWIGSWRNVDASAMAASAADAKGNNATAIIESPPVALGYISSGRETFVRAANVNSSAIWTGAPSTIYSTSGGNAAMSVRSDTVTEGEILVPASQAFDRGNEGTTRNESTLAFVLQPRRNSSTQTLLTNGSFESFGGNGIATGWEAEGTAPRPATYSSIASGVVDGSTAQRMQFTGESGDSGNIALYQAPIDVNPGDKVRASIWVSGTLTNAYGIWGVEGFVSAGGAYIDETDVVLEADSLDGTPQLFEVEYVCPANCDVVAVYLQIPALAATSVVDLRIDKATLVKVTNIEPIIDSTGPTLAFTPTNTGTTIVRCTVDDGEGNTDSVDFGVHAWPEVIRQSGPAPRQRFKSEYVERVLSDNPVGYWPLQEVQGGLTPDATGALNLTPSDVIFTGEDPLGLGFVSAEFPGYGNRKLHGNNSAHLGWTNDTDLTLEIWAKFDDLGSNRALMSMRSAADQCHFALVTVSGNLRFDVGRSLGDNAWSTSFVPEEGPWYHFVVVHYGATTERVLYVNGNPLRRRGPTAITALETNFPPPQFQIGSLGDNPAGFIGDIAHVAVYHDALTHEQVASHYSAALA